MKGSTIDDLYCSNILAPVRRIAHETCSRLSSNLQEKCKVKKRWPWKYVIIVYRNVPRFIVKKLSMALSLCFSLQSKSVLRIVEFLLFSGSFDTYLVGFFFIVVVVFFSLCNVAIVWKSWSSFFLKKKISLADLLSWYILDRFLRAKNNTNTGGI